MSAKDIIADSNLAFINQEFDTALNLAKQAISLDPKNSNAYKCAANAYMSLERYDEAIKNYSAAVKHDPNNGNRYYDLGFAQASNEKIADAMKNFAKAEELGCVPENTVQLYHILGIICFDIGRYDDALINLSKAEQIIGVNMDILQRKVVIYGMKNDIRNGLSTANQMKLIAPSEYIGYRSAFNLLLQADRYEDAGKELERAERYANPCMDCFFDCVTFELRKYAKDNNKEHFHAALAVIEKALKTLKPTLTEVMESYINAAEIYLQLEKPEQTINCLNAAQNPANAYNSGFEVIEQEFETIELTDYDLEDMLEKDRAQIAETYGDYGLEELVESTEPDEYGNRVYFTEIEEKSQDSAETYKLDESEKLNYTADNRDQINRLYVGAYTLKKDFEKVIEYARKLQISENTHNSYMGKYTEVNAIKELGLPEAAAKYDEVIKFFRNAMIKDPSDIMAMTFRVQCYIDIGLYDEAEKMCNLLTKELREPLLDKINEAKLGGD